MRRAAWRTAALLLLVATPLVARAATVQVVGVTPGGTVRPLSGAEVWLETWSGGGGDGMGGQEPPKLVGASVARTDAAGRVRFDDVPPLTEGEHVPTCVHRGISFRGRPFTTPTAREADQELRVYEPTTEQGDLSLDVVVELRLEEAMIFVEMTLGLTNGGRRAVDLRDRALRLPLWVPAVGGRPVDPGLIPPETAERHMRFGLDPARGRVFAAGGGVFYAGVVSPGDEQRLNVRYGLPITAERMALGCDTPVEMTSLVLSAAWSNRIAPILVAGRSFLLAEQPSGEHVLRAMRFDPPPKAGEVVVVTLDRLPRPGEVELVAAVAGAAVLLSLFAAAVWTGRSRRTS